MPKTDSFSAQPPTITIRGEKVRLRAVNHGFQSMCSALAKVTKKGQQIGPVVVVGFAVVYSLPPDKAYALLQKPKELEREMGMADHELTPADLRSIDAYLAGVMERSGAAQIEVKGTRRGKSQPAIPRKGPPRK